MQYYMMTMLIVIIGISLGAEENDGLPPDIDAFIETGMNDWDIPGLAVAVIKADTTVYARGFGVRKLGSDDKVDEHTIFSIASLTKAFTSAALGMLVDQGKLNWDDPVQKHLPGFKLYDPWTTREITIRDLLIHRSGLGRMIGNRLQFMTRSDSGELMYRLRYLEPEASFRAEYMYNNMMYMVAGQVIEVVGGQPWYNFVKENIFKPLGMERSSALIGELDNYENTAWPHQYIKGEVQTIPRRDFDNVGPAASINTSVNEFAQWMRLHLGEPGFYEDRQLIEHRTMVEIHRPQSVIPVDKPYEEFAAYGLGWGVRLYNDHIILRHAGAADGMNSFVVLVPEINLGIVVVANLFNEFMYALGNHIIDSYIGAPPTDWHEHYLNLYKKQYTLVREQRDKIHEARIADAPPSLDTGQYTGQYTDSLYGPVAVTIDDEGTLSITLWEDESIIAALEHWHYDTFRAVWNNPSLREKFVWFDLDKSGEVTHLNVEFNLRPDLLQVGAYPSAYTRVVRFKKLHNE